MTMNQPSEALAVAKPGLTYLPRDPRLLELVARAQLALGQNAEAAKTLETLTEVRPELLEARLYAAQAQAAINQIDRAIEHLDEALQIEPEHTRARMALSKLLIKKGQLERARKEIDILKTASPDDPEVLDQEAVLVYLEGDRKQAVEIYRQAFELSPDTNRVIALSQAELRSGQMAEAHSNLKAWVDEHPQDTAARRELAKLYESVHDIDAAEEQYARLAQELPEDASILNNYAWVAWKKGNTAQALKTAERAHALSPDSPEIQDTLGAILVDNGDYTRALELLQSSSSQLPDNPTIKYHLAQAHLGVNNRKEGLRALREALESNRQFQERAAAERLLRSLEFTP